MERAKDKKVKAFSTSAGVRFACDKRVLGSDLPLPKVTQRWCARQIAKAQDKSQEDQLSLFLQPWPDQAR